MIIAIDFDGVCKSAGQLGGFLCGWHNWLVHGAPHENNLVSCSADFHQLDICCKILEMPRPSERDTAWELSGSLRKLLRESNKLLESLEWELPT